MLHGRAQFGRDTPFALPPFRRASEIIRRGTEPRACCSSRHAETASAKREASPIWSDFSTYDTRGGSGAQAVVDHVRTHRPFICGWSALPIRDRKLSVPFSIKVGKQRQANFYTGR